MKSQSPKHAVRRAFGAALCYPFKQHIGAEGELCVSNGDRVLRAVRYPWTWENAAGTRAHLSGTVIGRYCPTDGTSFGAGGVKRHH